MMRRLVELFRPALKCERVGCNFKKEFRVIIRKPEDPADFNLYYQDLQERAVCSRCREGESAARWLTVMSHPLQGLRTSSYIYHKLQRKGWVEISAGEPV